MSFDPGIAPAVQALHDIGIDTNESCQGGEGHAWNCPGIVFSARDEDEALMAFRHLIERGFPAKVLNRAWHHCPDCYPVLRPEWEILFGAAAGS